jgi:hypothetical protein
MTQMERMTLRLSSTQKAWLKRLEDKLQLDRVSVIRLAITRLAEEEDVTGQKKKLGA